MFGSQALEVAIGLVLMFFVIALAASSFVEIGAQLLKVRGKDLEATIGRMLAGPLPTTIGELTEEQRTLLGGPPGAADVPLTASQVARLAGLPLVTQDLTAVQRTLLGLANPRPANEVSAPLSDAQLAKLGADPASHAVSQALGMFKGTSVYAAARAGSKRLPSYLSAKAFAEAVDELLDAGSGAMQQYDQLPAGLKQRLEALTRQPLADANAHLLAVKSGLEQWFDESMARLEGAYKRKVGWFLFAFGLVLAIGANASAFHVADRLWHDPVTREAVANASGNLTATTTTTPADPPADPPAVPPNAELQSVADTTDKLVELNLPVGWDGEAKAVWGLSADRVLGMLATVAGWLVTALLVTLGAPFWFNLLTQLVSLRSSTGGRPPAAADDAGSSTALRAELAATTTVPPAQGAYLVQGGIVQVAAMAPTGATATDPADRLAATFGLTT